MVATGVVAPRTIGTLDHMANNSRVVGAWPSMLAYGLSKILPGIATFAAVPILIATVGAAEYGIFSLAWALTLFSTSMCLGWLRQSALRATGDADRALGRLPRLPLLLCVAGSGVPVAGCLACFSVIRNSIHTGLVLILAALFSISMGGYSLLSVRSQRDGKAGRIAAAELVRVAGGLLVSLLLCRYVWREGAVAVLVGNTVGSFAGVIPLIKGARPSFRQRQTAPRLLYAYWHYGWPMSLWLAVTSALVYADRFAISETLGPTVAGRYAATADTIVRGTAMLASPVVMLVHPLVMAKWNAGMRSQVKATLIEAAKVLVAMMLLCIMVVTIAGPAVIHLFVPGPAPSRTMLLLLATAAALWQVSLLAHKPFEISGRNDIMLVAVIVAATITIFLDVVLVRWVGVTGAAIAFTVGATTYATISLVLGPRLLRRGDTRHGFRGQRDLIGGPTA